MSSRLHRLWISLAVFVPFAALIAAIVLLWNRYVFPMDIALFLVFHVLGSLGVTIGYHRLLTHQGFEASPWVRGFFVLLGCLSFEGRPTVWAATHIRHHAHADEEGDPHSPLEGLWHAHCWWMYKAGNFEQAQTYAPHLLEDPVVRFIDRWTYLWVGLSFLVCFLLGGWTGLLWGGFVRVFFTLHFTWSVNSICHAFGQRTFETTDESRNNWLIGLLAFGEGWHNNHHAFPRNAFHGMRWWQFDMSGLIIHTMEKLGLIWNVQRVSHEAVEAKKRQGQGFEEIIADLRVQLGFTIVAAREELTALWAKMPTASLPPSYAQSWKQLHESSLKRLDEIQRFAARAQHMKKQRVALYVREVQEIVQRAKQSVASFASA